MFLCLFSCLSSTVVSLCLSSSKWVYLQQRHRNQTATTVKCNQLQWLPPSSPASRGRYRAGREGDPHSEMSPRWIFLTVTRNRSLLLKCQRRGGESRASRSERQWGADNRGWDVVCGCSVFKNACVHMTTQTHRHPCPSDFVGPQCNILNICEAFVLLHSNISETLLWLTGESLINTYFYYIVYILYIFSFPKYTQTSSSVALKTTALYKSRLFHCSTPYII